MAIFPINGFLGTGATFEADLNLVVQLVMGVALVAGAFLAKRKRYVAHGICQTTVLLLNLGMIALVMWPSFQHQVRPAFPGSLHKWYYAVATIHSLVGGAAEFLGLYIVIVAGTRILPQSLRFKDWKRWMCGANALVYRRPHRCWDVLRLVYSAVPVVPGSGDLRHIQPMVKGRTRTRIRRHFLELGNISQVKQF